MERVSFQTGHSFWMYSLHHMLRDANTHEKRLSRQFDPLKGLPFLAAFTALDKLRAAFGFRTSAVLVIARRTSVSLEPSAVSRPGSGPCGATVVS